MGRQGLDRKPGAVVSLCALILILSSCASSGKGVREDLPSQSYGIASWYGADFHGRPTSSGEIYNMHSNTCAHKEYPFGTRLRVTHLSNGKAAECIVNDRGPFIAGRDIDLSYAVAREIGVTGPGVSRVHFEVTGRDPSYIRRVKVQSSDRKGLFAIQAGSFADKANAVRLKAALDLKYSNVFIEEAGVKGTLFHRVRLGAFSSFSSAWSIAEELGQEGYQPIIVKAGVRI